METVRGDIRPRERLRAMGTLGAPLRGWRLDRLVSRSIVYGALTGAILLVYAASVVIFRALLPGDVPYAVALMSTGAGALLALPLRDRLQRTVNRLMYGDRLEPYRAISRLGRQLEASLDDSDGSNVVTVVTKTVADALRLPYAAVVLNDRGHSVTAAAHGSLPGGLEDGELLRLPLVHAGEALGELCLAPRAPGEGFDAADRRLLEDLARQAGPAIRAGRLTADLRRSREHLVTTREEERRRLRRDLHDGVGPTLAGTLMKLEAARSRLVEHPEEADRLLRDLTADTRRTIDEVRRLTYDLRPPALDELGLSGAIGEQAARFAHASGGRLGVRVKIEGQLDGLPAAVEVAAFRIAVEALTNVARHSGAHAATLRLDRSDDALVVEVTDDGGGLRSPIGIGVGLRSMRERAEELGGELGLAARTTGGTVLRAWLPVRAIDADA